MSYPSSTNWQKLLPKKMENLQAHEGWQETVCSGRMLQLQPQPPPPPCGSSHFKQACCSVYLEQIHTHKSKMDDLCTNPKVSKTELCVRLSNKTLGWTAQHAGAAHTAHSVLWTGSIQKRWNLQAHMICLKICFEVLKAFKSFVWVSFMFSTPCVSMEVPQNIGSGRREMLTYKPSDHIVVQSKDRSSDHSECTSAVWLFLLKAAEH